jgi:hypothetical protein
MWLTQRTAHTRVIPESLLRYPGVDCLRSSRSPRQWWVAGNPLEHLVLFYETCASYNCRKFRRQVPDVAIPNTTIYNYVKRFRAKDYILDRNRTRKRDTPTEEKLNETGARLEKTTKKSLAPLAQKRTCLHHQHDMQPHCCICIYIRQFCSKRSRTQIVKQGPIYALVLSQGA